MAHEFPGAPVVAVGAVIVRAGRALVVRRAHEPRKGEWSLPGGRVELGESLVGALRREMREETGLDVTVGPVIEVFDRVLRAPDGRVRYHFVIVDYLCSAEAGEAVAGDDTEAVAWIQEADTERYGVDAHAAAVLRKGLALAAR